MQKGETHILHELPPHISAEAEFLDEIQAKVLGVFLLVIHGHLYSFALRFLFLQTHATSYIFLHTHATYYISVQFSYCTL